MLSPMVLKLARREVQVLLYSCVDCCCTRAFSPIAVSIRYFRSRFSGTGPEAKWVGGSALLILKTHLRAESLVLKFGLAMLCHGSIWPGRQKRRRRQFTRQRRSPRKGERPILAGWEYAFMMSVLESVLAEGNPCCFHGSPIPFQQSPRGSIGTV